MPFRGTYLFILRGLGCLTGWLTVLGVVCQAKEEEASASRPAPLFTKDLLTSPEILLARYSLLLPPTKKTTLLRPCLVRVLALESSVGGRWMPPEQPSIGGKK